jgi:hypothetical protein
MKSEIFACLVSCAVASSGGGIVYIIRHGEKTGTFGCLNDQGKARAKNLVNVFDGVHFEIPKGIFANWYHDPLDCERANQTVTPLAGALGLDIDITHGGGRPGIGPHGGNKGAAIAIKKQLQMAGGPILVAWEHMNIKTLAEDLGVDKNSLPRWSGEDFDTVYVLEFDGSQQLTKVSVSNQNREREVTVYHMFPPKYTGLSNKDSADYDGEMAFVFMTFQPYEATNPEGAIADNVFEMSTVKVTGFTSEYANCNAPGCLAPWCVLLFSCPKTNTDYCCQFGMGPMGKMKYRPTETTMAGRKPAGNGGWWYSFPKESQGVTWHETVQRRIKSACVAQAWRDAAGGCPQCKDLSSKCVADCIQKELVHDGDDSRLKAVWDQAFSNKTMCPDEPFPTSSLLV